MLWDLFCRVIDNFGDVGVCWRLAAGLAQRGERVRLWIDDASALTWMAPEGAAGVEVSAWQQAEVGPEVAPGEVVIEAFGCDPPSRFIARMAQQRPAPTWINLEYLSAEDYVERSHGLRSPQSGGPGAGLDKWFFYPGFTPRTGGLMRPTATIVQAPTDLLATLGIAPRQHERRVLLFCYPGSPLRALADLLADAPTLLLATPGPAQAMLATLPLPPTMRAHALPWLPQPRFDALLHATDLNFVRGEDSFVQAQWPGRPFVWQIYPQADGAHAAKLYAFLDRFDAAAGHSDPAVRGLWQAWNGLGPWPDRLPALAPWIRATETWRDGLLAQQDLITQLQQFVARRR